MRVRWRLLAAALTASLFFSVPASADSFSIYGGSAGRAVRPEAPARPAVSAAREAFEAGRSGVWLGARGEVVRLLRDDLKGRRHQRFVIRLPDGLTLLISHNIDAAPRVPLEWGDEVEVYGRYEWNKKGGVIHWTHRDPKGRLLGGWVRHGGRLYR